MAVRGVTRADRLKQMQILFNQFERAGLKAPPGDREATAALWVDMLEAQINKGGLSVLKAAVMAYIVKPHTNDFVKLSDFTAEVNALLSDEAAQREKYRRNLVEVEKRAEQEQQAYIDNITPEQRKLIDYLWAKHKGIVNYNRG